ncbi:MAG: lytic murein transglycosylase [Pseudomonadales bacterium]|nr:lytic murein transglycosylase [Pseudomonadales bacterium]
MLGKIVVLYFIPLDHPVMCMMRLLPSIMLACLSVTGVALADQPGFSECLGRIQVLARQQNLPEWVVQEVVPALEQQTRVIELDRKQPEFIQTFEQYFKARVTEQRVERGRQLFAEHRDFLATLTRQYGIPGQYLVAFWGLETNFGGYLGKMPTLDSLATLACDERRSQFFTEELLTALQLLVREKLSVQNMRGSWAGAMGHVQFMPTTYRQYAVDGDGDGIVDLWQSTRDALASAANYLSKSGWKTGERWGRQVLLPENFPYSEAELGNQQPLTYWRKLGLLRADGTGLPALPLKTSIVLPAGHTGPAFAVYPNFNVILRWNRSQSYAIAVGRLADRIAGGQGMAESVFKPTPVLNRSLIAQLQSSLNEQGYAVGEADGIIGPATRAALRDYQTRQGLVADGFPDLSTLSALGLHGQSQ